MNEALTKELSGPVTVVFPGQFHLTQGKPSREQVLEQIDSMAATLNKGATAVRGLYLRICQTIREHNISDEDARATLGRHMPEPRVSEMLRIARSDKDLWARFEAGIIGYRSALRGARYYSINTETWKKRALRRTAQNFIKIAGKESRLEFSCLGWKITAERITGGPNE